MLKKIWGDPVWSKVIAGGITFILGTTRFYLIGWWPSIGTLIQQGISFGLSKSQVPNWLLIVLSSVTFWKIAEIGLRSVYRRTQHLSIVASVAQAAEDANGDGVVDRLLDALAPQLWVNGEPYDKTPTRRSAMEFDLSRIPAGSRIDSATLTLRVMGFRGGSVTEVHGFLGDGMITRTDMADTYALSIGTGTFDVTPFVQYRVNAGDQFAGFMIKGKTATSKITYVSRVGSVVSGHPPTLAVSFTPKRGRIAKGGALPNRAIPSRPSRRRRRLCTRTGSMGLGWESSWASS